MFSDRSQAPRKEEMTTPRACKERWWLEQGSRGVRMRGGPAPQALGSVRLEASRPRVQQRIACLCQSETQLEGT